MSFVGDGMAAVVQGIVEAGRLLGGPPVVVGGLAVLARLSSPYRATVDLDLVDRLLGVVPHLEMLRAAVGAEAVEPAAVLLPTPLGPVKIDVLEVRQVELDHPSDDPGDRLHASAHAWAFDTATDVTIEVRRLNGAVIAVTTPVAEPGPLIAMKLQAVMNRASDKQGTDLLDIVRLMLDRRARPTALGQIAAVDESVAVDIARHVSLWFGDHRVRSVQWIRAAGGTDVTTDDVDLVGELLLEGTRRS